MWSFGVRGGGDESCAILVVGGGNLGRGVNAQSGAAADLERERESGQVRGGKSHCGAMLWDSSNGEEFVSWGVERGAWYFDI